MGRNKVLTRVNTFLYGGLQLCSVVSCAVMGSLETLSRLETVSRQHFYCLGLGLEPNCLGLSLGLEPHCLGLVPRQEISTTVMTHGILLGIGRQVIQSRQSDTMNFSFQSTSMKRYRSFISSWFKLWALRSTITGSGCSWINDHGILPSYLWLRLHLLIINGEKHKAKYGLCKKKWCLPGNRQWRDQSVRCRSKQKTTKARVYVR